MLRPAPACAAWATAAVLLAAGCTQQVHPSVVTQVAAAPTPATTAGAAKPAPSSPAPVASPSRPSPTRPTGPPAGFLATVRMVTAADLPHSWHPGCPLGPAALRQVTLTYWDFAGRRRTGRLVVNADVVPGALAIFRHLYAARFPLRSLRPVDDFGGSDPSSMAADNTSGFNCRDAVAPGRPTWSTHAYGRAIDVNPVENPYLEGGQVRPPNGARFTDRTVHRAGMAYRGGVLVSAFAAAGWQWGGRWSSSPDYQHFSADGR